MNGARERPAAWPAAALLSLSDRTGAAAFAAALAAGGTRILASGGTARHLEEAGVPVTPVGAWTGIPELLGGRVKTLHPRVHGAILARREEPDDMAALATLGIDPIDLVAVTLYPFEERAGTLAEAVAMEEIDVGGVALLRAAAKNHADVIVVPDPACYEEVLATLRAGGPSREQRRAWALAAFARTARYDAAIAADLARRAAPGEPGPPPVLVLALERLRTLRYGENPHQCGALYARLGQGAPPEAWREGKELSYNNLLDIEAAASLVWRFPAPACVIVKHGQPCGAASDAVLGQAYARALACDPQSAFGGIVACNRELDAETAGALARQFLECVAAPDVRPEAEEALKSRRNLRVLRFGREELAAPDAWEVRPAGRWVLVQGEAEAEGSAPAWRPVTARSPSRAEQEALRFAWEVAAAARSNAIAIARGTALVGLGCGQASRVDAVDVALMKARRVGHPLAGAVLASDGFFPFADSIERAAAAGIAAVVQPGGSVRDAEVIAACDRHGIAMMFTDRRAFRH